MIRTNRLLTVKASVTLYACLIYGCEREYSETEIANDTVVEEGEQLFNYHCLACHGAGQGMPPFPLLPGTGALQVKYNGSIPAVLADRTDLTPQLVEYFVRTGVSIMPAYRKTEISDEDLALIGEYLSRNNPDLQRDEGGK